MKQRVISGAVAFAVLVVVLLLFKTVALSVLLFAVSVLCAFELNRAFCPDGTLFQTPLFVLLCGIIAFFHASVPVAALFVGYFVVFFALTVIFPKKLSVERAAALFVISSVIAAGLYSFMNARTVFVGFDAEFVFFMCFAFPLCGDMFAYFFGRKFGKRPLSPQISPHKTWAGAYAAVGLAPIYSAVWMLIYYFLPFSADGEIFDRGLVAALIFAALLGVAVAFFGIVGDLLASAIKRFCGVKDYGWIMPGHGGAVDRLDSVCFTAPLTCAAFAAWLNWGGLI